VDVLAGLNAEQHRAVETLEGPLLILAGPGSGKTRVIAHRIANLITGGGTPPYRILAVTFTNKAAREMRSRVEALVGESVRDITLGTFHSVCARWLRIEGAKIGIDRGFNIYDDDDQLKLMKNVLEPAGIDPRQFTPRSLLGAISRAKNELVGVETYRAGARNYFEEVAARAYRAYQDALREAHALDFDDLLMQVVELFRSLPEVLNHYADRYLHVLIDEFQDTNVAQYILAKQLASGHGNICVVGDPDQSIYSWRSADIRNILNFEKDFPTTRIVLLEENYRSTQTILNAAHAVISAHPGRKRTERMNTNRSQGSPVVGFEAYDDGEEAAYVVAELRRLQRDEDYSYSAFAVMYRTNVQSRVLEEAFIEARPRIPYRLVGGTRFYERREVKDVLAYLRLIQNPFDSVSLLRVINVPPRGIGQKSLEQLRRWAQGMDVPLYSALQLLKEWRSGNLAVDSPPAFSARSLNSLLDFLSLVERLAQRAPTDAVAALIDAITLETSYLRYLASSFDDSDERLDNIEELKNIAAPYEELSSRPVAATVDGAEPALRLDNRDDGSDLPASALQAFLEDVALISDQDTIDERQEAVTLITLHAAKGLEYPVVFMVGLEEGILPHIRSFEDPSSMDEERRLAYVGMTRAKDHLYLLRAVRRFRGGMSSANPPSRYWKDLPEDVLDLRRRDVTAPDLRSRPKVFQPLAVTSRGDPMGRVPRLRLRETGNGDDELPLLKAGEKVRHAKFGEGIVVATADRGSDVEVTVAFKGEAGVKRLLLSFAPLEKVG
jgi:ATP-dependent DNA helicase UvrD/PcrA